MSIVGAVGRFSPKGSGSKTTGSSTGSSAGCSAGCSAGYSAGCSAGCSAGASSAGVYGTTVSLPQAASMPPSKTVTSRRDKIRANLLIFLLFSILNLVHYNPSFQKLSTKFYVHGLATGFRDNGFSAPNGAGLLTLYAYLQFYVKFRLLVQFCVLK